MFAPENGTASSMGFELPGGDLSQLNAAWVFPLKTLDEVECFLDLSMRPPSWGEGFLVMTCPPWFNTGSWNERKHGWKLGLFRSTYDILWLWWISGFSTEWEDEHELQQTNFIHKFFPLIFLEGFKVTWSRYILFFQRFCFPNTSSLASQKTSSIFSRSELPKVQYQWGFQRLWKKADEIQNFMGL